MAITQQQAWQQFNQVNPNWQTWTPPTDNNRSFDIIGPTGNPINSGDLRGDAGATQFFLNAGYVPVDSRELKDIADRHFGGDQRKALDYRYGAGATVEQNPGDTSGVGFLVKPTDPTRVSLGSGAYPLWKPEINPPPGLFQGLVQPGEGLGVLLAGLAGAGAVGAFGGLGTAGGAGGVPAGMEGLVADNLAGLGAGGGLSAGEAGGLTAGLGDVPWGVNPAPDMSLLNADPGGFVNPATGQVGPGLPGGVGYPPIVPSFNPLTDLPPTPPVSPSGPSGPGDIPPPNNAPGQVTGNVPVAPGVLDAATGASSPLAKLLAGQSLTSDEWLKLGGTGLATAMGMYNSGQTTDALKSLYDTQRADRAPALAVYNNALSNPDSWYQSAPAQGAVDAALRKLSVNGNPAGNPGDLAKAAAYNLGGYNQYLSGLAGPAFGGQATQAQIGTNLATQQGSGLTTLAGGLSDLLNPKQSISLDDLNNMFKQIGVGYGKIT